MHQDKEVDSHDNISKGHRLCLWFNDFGAVPRLQYFLFKLFILSKIQRRNELPQKLRIAPGIVLKVLLSVFK